MLQPACRVFLLFFIASLLVGSSRVTAQSPAGTATGVVVDSVRCAVVIGAQVALADRTARSSPGPHPVAMAAS